MSIAMPKLTTDGLVLHDLGALPVPVAIQEVPLVPKVVRFVDLNPSTVTLTIFPHSSVLCPIVTPMTAKSMSTSAHEMPDIVGNVLASASVGHGAN